MTHIMKHLAAAFALLALPLAAEVLPEQQELNPIEAMDGLKRGDTGQRVKVLQSNILLWLSDLPVQVNGKYDDNTADAVAMLQRVYALGGDGTSVDTKTAEKLYRLSNPNGTALKKTKGAANADGSTIIEAARKFLGVPYDQSLSGADGYTSTDCGMLTRLSVINAGYADESFPRCADDQYYCAEHNQCGMTLVASPQPGDFVFFDWETSQSDIAYKGITHVAIFLGYGDSGKIRIIHAGFNDGVVETEKGTDYVAGYGRMNR